MNQNFIETFEALPQLNGKHAYQLALNSFEASFATEDRKQAWKTALDAVWAAG
jgi:adenosine deaminase